MYGRLPWFEPDEFNDEQRALYDFLTLTPRLEATARLPMVDEAGRMFGPFNAFMASPVLGRILHELGTFLRKNGGYSVRVREVAILELAVLRRCATEWHAHEPVALKGILTAEEVAAIKGGAPAPTLDAAETITRRLVQALVWTNDVDDQLYAEADALFGPQTLVELFMLIKYFDLLATAITVFRAAIPAGKPSPFG